MTKDELIGALKELDIPENNIVIVYKIPDPAKPGILTEIKTAYWEANDIYTITLTNK